jgi:hypothetical protein
MDYTDAMKLMRAHRAKLQTALYRFPRRSVVPADAGKHPFHVAGLRGVWRFLPDVRCAVPNTAAAGARTMMHSVRGHRDQRQAQREAVRRRQQRRREINMDGHDYRVVGVLGDWNPQPRFYDVVNNGSGFATDTEDVFVPFTPRASGSIRNDGNTSCNVSQTESGWDGLAAFKLHLDHLLGELDDAATVTTYRQFWMAMRRPAARRPFRLGAQRAPAQCAGMAGLPAWCRRRPRWRCWWRWVSGDLPGQHGGSAAGQVHAPRGGDRRARAWARRDWRSTRSS